MTYVYKVTRLNVTRYYSSESKARYVFLTDTADNSARIEWLDGFAIVWSFDKAEQIGTIHKIKVL